MRTLFIPASLSVVALVSNVARAQPGAGDLSVEDRSTVDLYGNVHDRWVPRDPDGIPLSPDEFYHRIGRDDLVEARAHRREAAIGALLGGIALAGLGIYFIGETVSNNPPQTSCDVTLPIQQFQACADQSSAAFQAAMDSNGSHAALAVGTLVGAAALGGVAAWLFTHPEPISEEEAERLAANHERGHIVGVAPYAGAQGGGVSLSGRF